MFFPPPVCSPLCEISFLCECAGSPTCFCQPHRRQHTLGKQRSRWPASRQTSGSSSSSLVAQTEFTEAAFRKSADPHKLYPSLCFCSAPGEFGSLLIVPVLQRAGTLCEGGLTSTDTHPEPNGKAHYQSFFRWNHLNLDLLNDIALYLVTCEKKQYGSSNSIFFSPLACEQVG